MRQTVFVYISGPITARNGILTEENQIAGLKTFLRLTELGIPSISPQMLGGFPSAHTIAYDIWMQYDFAVIDRCTHMLMQANWRESPGALKEKEYAELLGMPIAYSVENLLDILQDRE